MGPENENEIMNEVVIDGTKIENVPEVELTIEEPVVEPVVPTDTVTSNDHFMVTVNALTFVRTEANEKASPICMVKEGARLTVDPTKSTDEFYRVSTESGVGGYCGKKFVTVK